MLKKRCLQCSVKFTPKRSDQKFCQDKCRVYYSRIVRNKKVTDKSLNSNKVILSLCDFSGVWSAPYKKAGYDVVKIDIKTGVDVRLLKFPEKVYGVLAAPPCTHFSGSGAMHWKQKGNQALLDGLSVFDACARIILFSEPSFWVFENPIGRLRDYIGPPVWIFDPYQYGDDYTKKTCLWGKFNIPELGNFPKPKPSLPGHHSIDDYWKRKGNFLGNNENRATLRSITPLGFAEAFFYVNR